VKSRLPGLPAGRRLIALDVALALWAVVWVVLALEVATEVRGLSDLSSTVSRVGTAVEESGKALSELTNLPLGLGDRLDEPAKRIEEAGRSANASGRSSRESVDSLSKLLAVAIGVIPSLPLLGFYLPLRVGYVRERRALRRLLDRAGADADLQQMLARRALTNLSYHRLEKMGDPWRDFEEGRHGALADAELARLGLRPGGST